MFAMDSLIALLKAFLVGGAICALGQVIMDLARPRITPAHVLVGYVTGGAILSYIGWYKPLVELGGAGATVPLSGFGHNLAQGTIEGVKNGGLIGIFSGGIQSAAAGITAAVVFGYIIALIFNPKN